MFLSESDIKRFWSYVVKTDTCWNWIGCYHRDGYGHLKIRYSMILAHRISYKIHIEDPGVLQVRHKCDNRKCVNPEHLIKGTNYDNVQDRVRRNRSNRVVPLELEKELKELFDSGVKQYELAFKFKLKQQTISKAIKRYNGRTISN